MAQEVGLPLQLQGACQSQIQEPAQQAFATRPLGPHQLELDAVVLPVWACEALLLEAADFVEERFLHPCSNLAALFA